jgi:hypothetical protein
MTKHLEHKGNEIFEAANVSTAELINITEEIVIPDEGEEEKEKRLLEAQKTYMHFNNPLLWNGDIDLD